MRVPLETYYLANVLLSNSLSVKSTYRIQKVFIPNISVIGCTAVCYQRRQATFIDLWPPYIFYDYTSMKLSKKSNINIVITQFWFITLLWIATTYLVNFDQCLRLDIECKPDLAYCIVVYLLGHMNNWKYLRENNWQELKISQYFK